MWRDLTVRKRRDTVRRPGDVHVKYRVRAVGKAAPGLPPVINVPEKTYEGPVIDLAYLGDAVESNITFVSMKHGRIRAAFTNGILSAHLQESRRLAPGEGLDTGRRAPWPARA
ncbi:MAG TPA: hypothetical protein VJ276_25620 [Thermoanaerobaculia bacterium]|nr:hypothetical protein [Thermoanaerobaculia bacterium]